MVKTSDSAVTVSGVITDKDTGEAIRLPAYPYEPALSSMTI